MAKHTPTPWSVDDRFKTLIKGGGHSVATTGGYQSTMRDPEELAQELEANARHIVKCVNNHARLVEALRKMMALPEMERQRSYLSKGIGTRTEDGQAILEALSVLHKLEKGEE